MRRLLPFALLLAACAPAEQGAPHQADSGASGKPTEVAQTPPEAKPAVAPKGNPNRIHQLEDLQTIEVDLKGHKVRLWVMDDESKEQEGMMFLEDGDVKADEGMLFKFPSVQLKSEGHGFWMRNTLIPLDIVYLSPSGQVLNVGHGKPRDDTQVPPEGDYLNVIELKAGTAARLGLKPGDKVILPGA